MPTSIYFLALSQAPPVLEAEMAICQIQLGQTLSKRYI